MYDSPLTSIYRVVVAWPGGYARVNVKASSPSRASDWVLHYPMYAGLPGGSTLMQVTASYKLRNQPVWMKKSGHDDYRFDLRDIQTVPKSQTIAEASF